MVFELDFTTAFQTSVDAGFDFILLAIIKLLWCPELDFTFGVREQWLRAIAGLCLMSQIVTVVLRTEHWPRIKKPDWVVKLEHVLGVTKFRWLCVIEFCPCRRGVAVISEVGLREECHLFNGV